MWCTCPNTIPGWYMAIPWLSFQAGMPIRVYLGRVRASDLDLVLGLVFLAASAGAGTIGDSIGTTAGGQSITTTRTSPAAGQSSTAMASTTAVFTAAALGGMRASATPTQRPARIPAPSAGSIMEALQEPTHSKDDPVLAVSMEQAAEASTQAGAEVSAEVAAEAPTAGEATDSLREVNKT